MAKAGCLYSGGEEFLSGLSRWWFIRGKRSKLATEIIKGVMLPQFVISPLAVLLVWLALARGVYTPERITATHTLARQRRLESD